MTVNKIYKKSSSISGIDKEKYCFHISISFPLFFQKRINRRTIKGFAFYISTLPDLLSFEKNIEKKKKSILKKKIPSKFL